MSVSITRIVKFIRKGERGNGIINAVTPIRHFTLSFWNQIGAANYNYTWANISNYADMKIGDTMVVQGTVTDKNDISVTYYGTIMAIDTTSVRTIATALIMSGADGSSFAAQYSMDGANWHDAFTDGDIYMRVSDDGGKTWSNAIRIVGEKGGETNYQFAWSSHKALDDSEDPLSDVVDWDDYPSKKPDDKDYLWTMITAPDGKVSYARLTGEKGDKGDPGDTGSPGAKGDRGPALRGPQAWDDCAVGYVFQSGAEGEDFKDVVLHNDNYYSCVKSHAKAADNAPLSTTDTSNGYWKLADKFEVIATKILLAQYALVKNLGVEAIEMKDSESNIIFEAKDGNVTCNNGTFNNIKVNGDIVAKSLRLKVAQDNTVTDGAVACAVWNDPIILPELENGECMNIKISAPLITRSSAPAEVKPKNNKVKIWVHGSTDAPVSKNITLDYGIFDAVGIGYNSETIWAIR